VCEVDLPEDQLGVLVQRPSRLGRSDSALAADEQLLSELGLQRGQVLAERGLRDVQDVGCARDAPRIDDLDEGVETPGVHAEPSVRAGASS
jgi:hypothetical protein